MKKGLIIFFVFILVTLILAVSLGVYCINGNCSISTHGNTCCAVWADVLTLFIGKLFCGFLIFLLFLLIRKVIDLISREIDFGHHREQEEKKQTRADTLRKEIQARENSRAQADKDERMLNIQKEVLLKYIEANKVQDPQVKELWTQIDKELVKYIKDFLEKMKK